MMPLKNSAILQNMSTTKAKITTHKKAVPNSLRLKATSRNSFDSSVSQKNMPHILNKLPLLHQLKETENSLLKLLPIWQKWCALQHNTLQHNSSRVNFNSGSQLKHLKDGVLSISCESSTLASLIKHQQNSLLHTFHNGGIKHVHTIKTLISLNQKPSSSEINSLSCAPFKAPKKTPKQKHQELTPEVLKSIEAVQPHIKSEQLAASLNRLAATLKKSIKG